MKMGVCCPVWTETRYLPLVLEQMSLCLGPKLVLWQDQPLYWLGEGPAPSGHASRVAAYVGDFPNIRFSLLDHAPEGEHGGFNALVRMGAECLHAMDADIIVWMDSDWLYTLDDVKRLYATIQDANSPSYYGVNARHYWRDFNWLMADTGILAAFPWNHDYFAAERSLPTVSLTITCYHPSYVLSDEEMYRKVHSFGHAPYFKERGFYEKEWTGRDDSLVKPKPTDTFLPTDIYKRLIEAEALL